MHIREVDFIDSDVLLYIISGVCLMVCTITDIKSKKIYLAVIITGLLFIFGCHMWQGTFSFVNVITTLIVCILFIIASVLSGGQIGYGDAFLFAVTGSGLGFMANIFIIMFSFIFAFCAAVFFVVIKHKSHNYSMPLAPFVLGSFIFYVGGLYLPV